VSPRLCAAQRAEAGRKASVEAEDREEEQRKTQADVLLELASGATLFHTPEREGFVDVLVGDHRETHRICGAAFRRWLRHQYYKSKKRGCNSDALKVAVETLDAKAIFESESRDVHVRVASYYDDIYIDLGDNGWKAIKVTKAGWSIVANPPLRFQRAPSMRPLPVPAKGGSIQLLRPFCNLSDNGFTLFVAVLLAGLRPDSNYPVPTITGEQGAGKSSLARILTRLIDSRLPEQRSMPRSEEDLLVAAKGQHVLVFDNVSGLPDWLSDAICRLSTGGGAGKRRLYTDEDEVLLSGRRLVCINGIEDVAVRPDLVDRAILLALEPIAEDKRRAEEEYNGAFDQAASKILGALLDGVVRGLRDLATTQIADKPRMADFALWAEACTRLYWPAGTFLQAYRDNLAGSVELVLEGNPVGDAVRAFMADGAEWSGTASALLPLLTALIPEQAAKGREWPKRPDVLAGKLRRVAPALRRTGIHVAFVRAGHTRTRIIQIESRREAEPVGKGEKASALSAPSAEKEKPNNDKGLSMDGGGRHADSANNMRTAASTGCVRVNSLQNHAEDGADTADASLHLPTGNGPVSDVDAVLEELAAQGKPTNGLRLPGWRPMARVTVREVRLPAIAAGIDDDIEDIIDPRWR
jgi:hypothetical protein